MKIPNLDGPSPMYINLSVYNDSAIHAFETCTIPLISLIAGHTQETNFYVSNHHGSMLFSCEDSLYLQLIQPHLALAEQTPHNAHIISSEHDTAYVNFISRNKHASHYQVAQSSTPSQVTACNNSIPCNQEQIKEKYSDIFEGAWDIPRGAIPYAIGPQCSTCALPCRPVPIHQEGFKDQLTDMENASAIVPVHEATAWISSYVIAETENKKKKMWICLDPTPLNKAVMREPFYYCTPDDVYSQLAKATCFTVINFKKDIGKYH